MIQNDKTKKKSDVTPEDAKNLGLFSKLTFVQAATVIYSLMATIGALICLYGNRNFYEIFAIPSNFDQQFQFISSAILACGILLIASYLSESWLDAFADIKGSLTRLLSGQPAAVAIYLAFISAVGEELLFRGAMQPFAGLLLTSIVFGLAHLGPEGISIWTVWAFFAGLLLGWITQVTGSILPAIFIHFIVNSFSLLRFRNQLSHTDDRSFDQ